MCSSRLRHGELLDAGVEVVRRQIVRRDMLHGRLEAHDLACDLALGKAAAGPQRLVEVRPPLPPAALHDAHEPWRPLPAVLAQHRAQLVGGHA